MHCQEFKRAHVEELESENKRLNDELNIASMMLLEFASNESDLEDCRTNEDGWCPDAILKFRNAISERASNDNPTKDVRNES